MKRRLFACALAAAVLLAPGQVQAAQGIGLSPAIHEVVISEGEEAASFDVTISNSSASLARLQLSLLDFGSLDESGGIAFLGRTSQETSAFGLRQWMSLDKESLELEPGQAAPVTVTIRNDTSLSPGGHYGAVVVSAQDAESANSDSVTVLPATSTLVLVQKTDGAIVELKVQDIKANSSLLNLPKTSHITFRNDGNTHAVPRGVIELMSPTGSIVSRGTVNETSSFVLPGSTRHLPVDLQAYGQPWLPGRYKLVTTWRYDGQEEVTITTQSFWYVGKATVWLIVIISLGIVLFLFVRNRRRPPTRN